MALFASSSNGETALEEPTEFLKNLCKIQKVTEQAQTVPTQTLEYDHNCIIEISPELAAQALQRGMWLFTAHNIPSDLMIFAVPRPNGNIKQAALDQRPQGTDEPSQHHCSDCPRAGSKLLKHGRLVV
jgi:hypothetical protein